MNKKYIPLIAGVFSAAMAQSAYAMPTVFDFTASNLGVADSTAYNSVGMTVDGISLGITAYTIDNDGNGNISNMTQVTGNGAGVYVSSSENLGVFLGGNNDGHSMDGGDPGSNTDFDEGLMFIFDQQVTLTYVNFDNWGVSDDFNLTVDGITKLVDYHATHAATSFVSPVSGQADEYAFDLTGTEFLFWADGDSDSFRIDYLEVSAVTGNVPVPAPLFLLSAGLIGLGYSRYNRKTEK